MLSGLQHYRLVLEKDGSLEVLTEQEAAKPKTRQSAWVSVPVSMLAPGRTRYSLEQVLTVMAVLIGQC
jgi:hypothetical protein